VSEPLNVYIFRDAHFAPNGDTVVCIVGSADLRAFMTADEVAEAFSGHAVYWRWPWRRYVGVWGDRNASRFRRFLRERGAELLIRRERPPKLRLGYHTTANSRKRVRRLEQVI